MFPKQAVTLHVISIPLICAVKRPYDPTLKLSQKLHLFPDA